MLIGIRVLIGICNTFASAVQKTAAAAFRCFAYVLFVLAEAGKDVPRILIGIRVLIGICNTFNRNCARC